jgi:uncharacterized damage-inducible protein DinB
VGTPAIPSPKQQFLEALQREHETTMRVINAFPAGEGSFQPHPRSKTATQLVWNFVVEESMLLAALRNQLDVTKEFPKPPAALGEAIGAFRQTHANTVEALNAATDTDLARTVKFFTGPKAIGDVPMMQFAWFLLCDQIHHRGQLSIYVRMAGGKVPSIYGPSADEPWM